MQSKNPVTGICAFVCEKVQYEIEDRPFRDHFWRMPEFPRQATTGPYIHGVLYSLDIRPPEDGVSDRILPDPRDGDCKSNPTELKITADETDIQAEDYFLSTTDWKVKVSDNGKQIRYSGTYIHRRRKYGRLKTARRSETALSRVLIPSHKSCPGYRESVNEYPQYLSLSASSLGSGRLRDRRSLCCRPLRMVWSSS